MNMNIYQDTCSVHLSRKRNDTHTHILPIKPQTEGGRGWQHLKVNYNWYHPRFTNIINDTPEFSLYPPLQSLHKINYLQLPLATYSSQY